MAETAHDRSRADRIRQRVVVIGAEHAAATSRSQQTGIATPPPSQLGLIDTALRVLDEVPHADVLTAIESALTLVEREQAAARQLDERVFRRHSGTS